MSEYKVTKTGNNAKPLKNAIARMNFSGYVMAEDTKIAQKGMPLDNYHYDFDDGDVLICIDGDGIETDRAEWQ